MGYRLLATLCDSTLIWLAAILTDNFRNSLRWFSD